MKWAERPIWSGFLALGKNPVFFTRFYPPRNHPFMGRGYTVAMQDMDLAYTPHPNDRREAPIVIRGAAPQAGSRAASSGLGLMAAASLSILSTAALLGPGAPPLAVTETVAAAPEAGKTRAFVPRESAQEIKAAPQAPVLVAGAPVPLETRAASPLPVAGGVLGPVPEPAVAPAPVAAAREQHTLVGFDGVTTMTDGPARQGNNAAPEPAYARNDAPEQSARPSFPPPPVVWNNPIQWIKVHQDGL